MKIPQSKRMKNNASSAVQGKELKNLLISRGDDASKDSTKLVSKHTELQNNYLKRSAPDVAGESPSVSENRPPIEIKPNRRWFAVNKYILKIKTRSNFPTRFPLRLNNESSLANLILQEEGQELIPVASSGGVMTKVFLKFWNKVIMQQDDSTGSAHDHQLTELESGYFPCQLNSLFDSPESYLKKSYCHRIRYFGPGYQLLPAGNHFVKIASRTLANKEMQTIYDHYSNSANQYFLIPIEFSSKLSRCMLKSNEISQSSQGCNKITFSCQARQDANDDRHPICTIEYKSSIDCETLPATSMSLVDNFQCNLSDNSSLQSPTLKRAFFNYPFLLHFLHRSDFSIDEFFARCWHYSRYFTERLDLGSRVNGSANLIVRESIFKYLISCSARICVAIKYWVLNPDGATYFRCWCGQKLYDQKQESKLLNRMSVGSAELFNFQQNIRDQKSFHLKHVEKKSTNHICACNQQFNDHKLWMAHIFSNKISDISKVCPIFMYNLSQQCHQENQFVCECTQTFSDYDFWSFWLHTCSCSVLKSLLKSSCGCNPNKKAQKKSSSGVGKPAGLVNTIKRSRLSRTYRSKSVRSNDKSENIDFPEEEGSESSYKHDREIKQSEQLNKDFNDASDENWLAGDNVTISKQINFNHSGCRRCRGRW